jgi:hypothetical protein
MNDPKIIVSARLYSSAQLEVCMDCGMMREHDESMGALGRRNCRNRIRRVRGH